MGEMLALAAPKLRIEVSTSVLAKPHNPLIKYAVAAAITHKYIFCTVSVPLRQFLCSA